MAIMAHQDLVLVVQVLEQVAQVLDLVVVVQLEVAQEDQVEVVQVTLAQQVELEVELHRPMVLL